MLGGISLDQSSGKTAQCHTSSAAPLILASDSFNAVLTSSLETRTHLRHVMTWNTFCQLEAYIGPLAMRHSCFHMFVDCRHAFEPCAWPDVLQWSLLPARCVRHPRSLRADSRRCTNIYALLVDPHMMTPVPAYAMLLAQAIISSARAAAPPVPSNTCGRPQARLDAHSQKTVGVPFSQSKLEYQSINQSAGPSCTGYMYRPRHTKQCYGGSAA